MLRVTDSASARGAKEYFDKSLRHADYYAEGQEVSGLWHGSALPALHLHGEVSREGFQSLIDNRHPATGAQLTPRMKADRRPGTDFTFNAPKSVSLIYAINQDARIVSGFRRAVEATMADVERDVKTRVRVRGRNEDRVTGNLVWAEFLHHTARPVGGLPDPHLHIHAYVPNLTFDAVEGRWKAIQLGDIKADGAYYEALFLSRLAIEMRALGYTIERSGHYWDIAGIPRRLVEQFSRRTAEIERAASEQGIVDPDRKGTVGARTRERKAESLSMSELRDSWIARIGPVDRAAMDRVMAAADAAPLAKLGLIARDAVSHAMEHAFERASVVGERQLLTAALHRAYGDAGPERLHGIVGRMPFIRRMIEGRVLLSTPEVLAEEAAMLAFAREGRLTCRPLAPEGHVLQADFLNGQQRNAVAHLLASPDRLMVLRGGAGTGKTTLMQEAVRGIRAGGHGVLVFAPTSAARDVLRREGFHQAETLQRLLADTDMQEALRGSVLWIDEAGLVAMPEMAALTRIAGERQCRIILSGDSRQHGSVARGDALRLLETRAGITPAEVHEIVRQRGSYKEAVAAIAAGRVDDGLHRFRAMGAIVELDGPARLDQLAADYAQETRAGRSVLVVSPTHREKDETTAHIRAALLAEKRLGSTPHHVTVLKDTRWTVAERSDPARYHGDELVKFHQNAAGFTKGTCLAVQPEAGTQGEVRAMGASGMTALPLAAAERFKVYRTQALELRVGDAVRITENGRTLDGHRLTNGATYHVRAFDAAGNFTLRENGWKVGRDFGHLDHGYCTTSVSSQGRTVDTVLAAMGRESLPAMSQEQFYVTASRGRHAFRLYTDDYEAVQNAVTQSGARGSATELLDAAVDRKGVATAPARQERLHSYVETVQRMAAQHAHEHAKEAGQPPVHLPARVTEIHHQGVVTQHATKIDR